MGVASAPSYQFPEDANLQYRAYFYSVYIMEEAAFEDTAQMTIATGCVGERTGLRGQLNRCLFSEFVDFLWAPEKGKTASTKPNPAWVIWGNAEKKDLSNEDLSKITAEKLKGWIQMVNYQNVPDPTTGKITKQNLPGAGYTGYMNTKKMIPSAVDYYDGLKKAGIAAWRAKEAYRLDETLSAADRKKWDVWGDRCSDAAALATNFRIQDKGKKEGDFIRKRLSSLFVGRTEDVVRVDAGLIGGPGGKVSGAKQMDRDRTAAQWASLTGATEEDIKDEIDKGLVDFGKQPNGPEHAKALEECKGAYRMTFEGRC